MLRAEKRKQQEKMHQKKIIDNFFEQLWKVVENTKVVHYFDNSKGFFFRGQNLKGLAENQVQNLSTNMGATCQHLGVC